MNTLKDKLAVCCPHIIDGSKPVLYIDYDDEKRYSFMCGEYHEDNDDPAVIHIGHLLQNDDSLYDAIIKLKINMSAERSIKTDKWVFKKVIIE